MNTQPEEFKTGYTFASQLLEVSDQRTQTFNLARLAHGVWTRFIELFAPSSDVRIFTGCDRHGITYYRVYDVSTQDFHHFESEDELRIWLENRYYQ